LDFVEGGALRAGGTVRTHSDNGDACVVLSGDHDFDTVGQVRTELGRALSQERPIIVDLSEATFIDSTILLALIETNRVCERRGTTLTLRPGPHPIRRLLELTGLAHRFQIET
jgi:anti-anti-sigma factor